MNVMMFSHFGKFSLLIPLSRHIFDMSCCAFGSTTDAIAEKPYAKSNMKSCDYDYYSYCYNEASL